jgi:hypothetical protein
LFRFSWGVHLLGCVLGDVVRGEPLVADRFGGAQRVGDRGDDLRAVAETQRTVLAQTGHDLREIGGSYLGLSRHTELILRLDLLSVISRFLAAELPKTRVIAASYRAQQPRPGGPATLATP